MVSEKVLAVPPEYFLFGSFAARPLLWPQCPLGGCCVAAGGLKMWFIRLQFCSLINLKWVGSVLACALALCDSMANRCKNFWRYQKFLHIFAT